MARTPKHRLGAPSSSRLQRLRDVLYLRGEGCCHICGQLLHATFVIDHIVPLIRGGTWDEANLAVAHGPCNARKASRLMEELPPIEERRGWQYSNAELRDDYSLRWALEVFA